MQENRIASVTASSSSTTSETSPTGNVQNEKASDITSNTNTSTNANDIDQAQFEADKRAVYKWVSQWIRLDFLLKIVL